jgi:tungstate transport system ATP-binding protein
MFPMSQSNLNSILEARNLQVQRNNRNVLNVDHFDLQEGETLAIIGPNGAGKSTLLLVLGNLLNPSDGEIFFRGVQVDKHNGLNYRRKIGLVLQEPLLLDSSVFDNVAMGLRFRKVPKDEITQRVEKWLNNLGIAHLKNRPAREISGGESQRVSLARVFVLDPEILFLDEPFSSLDTPTRTALLHDLHVILKEAKISTVFVTHDMDEALSLGDRVAVLLDGKIRQIGQPEHVFSVPADREVAAFVGIETIVPAQITSSSAGQVQVDAQGVKLEAVGDIKGNAQVYFCIRPEDVTLYPGEMQDYLLKSPSSARNRLLCTIQELIPQGPVVRVLLECSFSMEALITKASAEEMELSVGREVIASFKASAVHLIPR